MTLKSALALAAAGVIGFGLGGWRTRTVEAARDTGKVLMALDRDFDDATASRGLDGWMSFFAGDAVMMPAGAPMLVGADAIRQHMRQTFLTPGFALRWEPVDGYGTDDLGYTYGVYKTTAPDATGKLAVSYGKYVTIWRREGKDWKIVLDCGNASPPPERKSE
jgi:ketosteroid isomerase-like protein